MRYNPHIHTQHTPTNTYARARSRTHTHTHTHTHKRRHNSLSRSLFVSLSRSLFLYLALSLSLFLSHTLTNTRAQTHNTHNTHTVTHSQTHAHKHTTHTIHTQEVSKALSTLLLTPAVLTAALQEHTAACGNMHIIRKSARKSPTISERAKYMYAHKSPWIMRQCSWQCSKSPRMYPVCAKEPLNMHFYSHSAL